MANALLSPKVYANTALKMLKNNLVMGRLVSGEYKDEYKKVGSTVYAKRVPEFTVRDGAVASAQDVVEGEIAIAIDQQKGVDIQFTSVEETLTVDSLMRSTTLSSAMASLAQQIDGDIHAETKKFYNWAGTPGQLINSYADLSKGPQRADEMGIETGDRVGVMHPSDAWAMLGSLSSVTNEKIAGDALTKARLPNLGDIDWYSTQNAATVTTGTRSGNCLVDGANQNSTYASVKDGNWTQELDVDAMGNATTAKAGEVFTIANVYACNPRSKARMSYLQQFTLTENALANSTSSGQATLTISPPIITSGPFQTVVCAGTSSTAPDDDAAIQWMGSDTEGDTDATTYNFATIFRKPAIALVSAKLIKPYSGESDYSVDKETGIAIRYWRTSDGTNDTHLHRFDVLYGVKNIDPRRGVRLSGTA